MKLVSTFRDIIPCLDEVGTRLEGLSEADSRTRTLRLLLGFRSMNMQICNYQALGNCDSLGMLPQNIAKIQR